MALILKILMLLPNFLLIKLSGSKAITVAGRTLSPRFQLLCAQFAKGPAMEQSAPAAAREQYHSGAQLLGEPTIAMQTVVDEQLTVPDGEILLRRYIPDNNSGAAVVYYHGGGWVIGDVAAYDGCCRLLAQQIGCQVIAVDYRLAPEHPFPTASNDAIAAFNYVLAQADQWQINKEKVVVMGDSAGGHLSAVVSQQQKQQGLPQPKLQVLVYPVTDLSQQSASYTLFGQGFILTKALMEWFINHYTPNQTDRLTALASPLLSDDLSDLCPAIIATAGFDPLHDEGEAYANKLTAAQVQVDYTSFAQLPHGYITMTGMLPEAKQAVMQICNQVKQALA